MTDSNKKTSHHGEAAQALANRVRDHMFANDAASKLLGMKIISVTPGRAELAMHVRTDMVNGHGMCHGGFIFSLADSAFAFACNSHNHVTVASACTIDFIRPVQVGDQLRATAVERALAGRTGVYDIAVANERGETVALFRGKSHRLPGHVIHE